MFTIKFGHFAAFAGSVTQTNTDYNETGHVKMSMNVQPCKQILSHNSNIHDTLPHQIVTFMHTELTGKQAAVKYFLTLP